MGFKIPFSLSKKIRTMNHWRIDAGRFLLLKVVRVLFDKKPCVENQTSGLGPIQKILILRLDGKLGDCITSTGFLRALHEAYPDAKLTVLTAPQTEHIYRSFPFLEVVSAKKGFLGTLRTWFNLRHESFDVSLNTSHIMIARTVFLMANIKSRIKISFNCTDYFLFTNHAVFDPLKNHVTARYQKVLEILNHPNADLSYYLPNSEKAKSLADDQLNALEGSPFIVINSFAGARFRSFNENSTVLLVQHFLKTHPGHKVVSIGGFGDLEILKEWHAKHRMENWFVFPACGDFFVNSRIVERADLVVSPDTAIVHLACALKKDLIAVYRSDTGLEKNSLIWKPYGNRYKMVLAQSLNSELEADINNFDMNEMYLSH